MSSLAPAFSMSPDTATDAVSSLRAKALLSRTNKRRKPASEEAVPIPSGNESGNNSLDYGIPDDPAAKEDSTREEGEISDSDDSPILPSKFDSPPHRSSLLHRISSIPPDHLSTRMDVSPISHRRDTHRNSFSAAAIPPPPAFSNGHSQTPQYQTHPGLPLTQSEYNAAKDIVLDLLGWGVPPEFLVDCGVSHEIVFYVFKDLHLRFPANFDWSHFDRANPVSASVPIHPTDMTLLQDQSRSQLEFEKSVSTGPSAMEHVNLAQKPILEPDLALRISAPQLMAQSQLDEDYLHDIERQRRQELLARKAVQASMKSKAPSSIPDSAVSSSPPTTHQLAPPSGLTASGDVEMASISNVDDFLNSISPTNVPEDQNGMDVEMRDASPRPSSAMHPWSLASAELNEPIARPESSVSVQRRGPKRPVAIDFVDNEGAPSPDPSGGVLSRSSGNFANIAMRRCVIDLSDSEPEPDDEPSLDDPGRYSPGAISRHVTPPVNGSHGARSLLRKEKDIELLRERIAERERERSLKRIGSGPMGTVPPRDASVKEEDDTDPQSFLVQPKSPSPISNGAIPTSREPVMTMTIDSSVDLTNGKMHVDQPPPEKFGKYTWPLSQLDILSSVASTIDQRTTRENADLGEAESESVDGDGGSSSAQALLRSPLIRLELEGKVQDFRPNDDSGYQSVFRSYPLLRSEFALDTHRFPCCATSPSTPISISLSLLILSTICKALDPLKHICQFEIPGGGVCRDNGCSDNHLYSRAVFGDATVADRVLQDSLQPTDEDTANYLAQVLPTSWLAQHNITSSKIHELLKQETLRDSNNPTRRLYEQRVAQVLFLLGFSLEKPT